MGNFGLLSKFMQICYEPQVAEGQQTIANAYWIIGTNLTDVLVKLWALSELLMLTGLLVWDLTDVLFINKAPPKVAKTHQTIVIVEKTKETELDIWWNIIDARNGFQC